MQATILVVDDTPSNISVLMEILRGDYRVLAAINGEQALKIARGRSAARLDPAGRDDAGDERPRGVPASEGRKQHAQDSGHLRDRHEPGRGRGARVSPWGRSITSPSRSARRS